MSWIPAEGKFDDEQLRIYNEIVEDTKRSWWIKGYAGTGKTMMLVYLAHAYLKAGYDCAYVTFTHALKNLVNEALVDLGNSREALPIYTVDALNSIGKRYDVVLVDEVQDLSVKQIAKLLLLGKGFIFAGDLNQSIFLTAAKPEVIKRLLGNPKVVELRDIHRLPEAISFASHLVYEEADSAENALVDVIENSSVNLVAARTLESEVNWVYEQALRESRKTKPSAILFSRHKYVLEFIETLCKSKGVPVGNIKVGVGKDYNQINNFLKKNRISLMYFGGTGGGEISLATKSKIVIMMTLHSAKGLEFESVFLPFMDDSQHRPCPFPSFKNNDAMQRRFVYVAVARTRLNFYASYTGEKNKILERLEDDNLNKYLNYFKA